MSNSKRFVLCGSLYLVLGILLGMYMSASGKHDLAPVHAHINLLGFALMTIFGIIYRLVPETGSSALASTHFWLHLAGTLVLLALLFLLMSGRITEAAMVPLAPISELAILVGILLFVFNVGKNMR